MRDARMLDAAGTRTDSRPVAPSAAPVPGEEIRSTRLGPGGRRRLKRPVRLVVTVASGTAGRAVARHGRRGDHLGAAHRGAADEAAAGRAGGRHGRWGSSTRPPRTRGARLPARALVILSFVPSPSRRLPATSSATTRMSERPARPRSIRARRRPPDSVVSQRPEGLPSCVPRTCDLPRAPRRRRRRSTSTRIRRPLREAIRALGGVPSIRTVRGQRRRGCPPRPRR